MKVACILEQDTYKPGDQVIERDTGVAVCSCCNKSLAERGCDDNGRRYK